MITIRTYADADESRWNDYVGKHPEGTLFHLSSWKTSLKKSFNHQDFYLIAEKKTGQGEPTIAGIFPLVRMRSRMFGDYLVSLPFAELGGPLADDNETETLLIDYASGMSRDLKCDYLEIRSRRERENMPTKTLYYNFSKAIQPLLEDNMTAIPRKSRAAVRHGIKSQLKTYEGNHLLSEFYAVLAQNFHQLGTPVFPRTYFQNLLEAHGENALITVVRTKEQQPVAAALTFFHQDRVVPYYAGSLKEYRTLAPNDFMYWELMKRGWERGCKVFDFGRSKAGTGSYDFKRHWGFEPAPLAYQYHLTCVNEIPNLSPANPKFQLQIQMWKTLPLFMTKMIGPSIARYLG